jgi:DNA-binding XRE family transcriptional regulator
VPTFPYQLLGEVKKRRLAIPADALFIGEYKRQSQRIGRSVTQAELAKALNITREWYCALENGNLTAISSELATKLARTLFDRRSARRVEWKLEETTLASLSEIRRYVKRISAASTYLDAAIEAIETGSRLVSANCVSVINLESSNSELFGHAIGPRARFWKPLGDRIVRDAHRTLQNGGVGISEYIPTADEVAANASVVLSFTSPSECHEDYDYECSSELWRDFNGELGMRSSIALPLRDRSGYRGTVAFAWLEPRHIALSEIELVRNLVATLELVS